MTHPGPTDEQIAFFAEHGWLAVEEAIPASCLAELHERVRPVLDEPERYAFDPSRDVDPGEGSPHEPILQSTLEQVWVGWRSAEFHRWARRMAAGLAGREVRFWFDQLLFKPPGRGAATPWHRDAAQLGLGEDAGLVTCWLALDPVDEESGCMRFLDAGHEMPAGREDDHGMFPRGWEPEEGRVVACPLPAGGATFHRGRVPHETPPNRSTRWRRALVQRFAWGEVPGLPDPG